MKRKKGANKKIKLKRVLLIITSFALLPLIPFLIFRLPLLFHPYKRLDDILFSSISGFAFFIIIYLVFGPPVRSYIVAHELTHVIFALLTGTKVKEVSVKREKSFVKTEKSNLLISISPYILPFYSFAIFLIYKFLSIFISIPSYIRLGIYFLWGISYSFHIVATIHYLRFEQPDLERHGYFFSLIFILVWFIVISTFLFWLMFPNLKLFEYYCKVCMDYLEFFNKIIKIF